MAYVDGSGTAEVMPLATVEPVVITVEMGSLPTVTGAAGVETVALDLALLIRLRMLVKLHRPLLPLALESLPRPALLLKIGTLLVFVALLEEEAPLFALDLLPALALLLALLLVALVPPEVAEAAPAENARVSAAAHASNLADFMQILCR